MVTRPDASLTAREWEVARLVAAGYSIQKIASFLQCEVSTVKSHIASMAKKIGGSGRPMHRITVFVIFKQTEESALERACRCSEVTA